MNIAPLPESERMVHVQDPDVDSPRSFCKKVLSASVVVFRRRAVDPFSFSASSAFC